MRMESNFWHHPPGRVELVGKDVALNRHHLAQSVAVSEGQVREGITLGPRTRRFLPPPQHSRRMITYCLR